MYGFDRVGVWESVDLLSLCRRFVDNCSKSSAKINNSNHLNMEKANAKKPCDHAELDRAIHRDAGDNRGGLTMDDGDNGGAKGTDVERGSH